jgi:tetratricopeptide (TPR) repeat protein
MTGYTTRQVAEILGLPPWRVRRWARSGLLDPGRGPRGEYRFAFRDVVLLRAVRDLETADVPARRVRRALHELQGQLPVGRPLSSVHITADGDEVVVRDERGAWEPLSGQALLDFGVAELAARAEPFARGTVAAEIRSARRLSPDDWYNVGVDLEAVAVEEAENAYREAIAEDPDHAQANVNLGRILHEAGRVVEAEEHYRRALGRDPDNPVASYNLGVALEDKGDLEGAIGCYRRSVRIDPDRADAHFNLARLYERRGEPMKALRHMLEYRKLTGVDPAAPG